MMEITCDLHIHTALSPCSVSDMTPNNIVNMSLLSELDVIAITDHNSCENIQAVLDVAKETDLLVIPGIEVETKEEIHVVCLFPDIELAYNVQEVVYNHLSKRKNKTKIFGEQTLFNSEDDEIGQVDKLLSFATNISLDELLELCRINNGLCIPAHIDRPSYSIISNLGMIPEHMRISTLEISRHSKMGAYREKYSNYRLIQSSDAHELAFIGICEQTLEVKEKTIVEILNVLRTT